MTVRRLLVLFNPGAGNGLVAARLAGLADGVPALADAVMGRIRSLDDAREAVARAQGRVTTLVAAGGDGTVALAAAALLLRVGDPGDAAPSLAVIPLGTGNAFAHGIGVGTLGLALETLRAGREMPCDVMRTTHQRAPVVLVSISAGFEGRYMSGYERLRARWPRFAASAATAAAALSRPGSRLRLVADGVELCGAHERSVNAGLYNISRYAFGREIWLDAERDDGMGEAVVCRTLRRYVGVLARGLRTAPACDVADPRWSRFRTALLESDDPLQADGEALPPGSVSVRIESGALRVLVPRGHST